MLTKHAQRYVPGQFREALKREWIPGVLRAADAYKNSAALLLAIGSRETNLDPRYLREPGDHGRGFGLTQLDIGSYPEWIATKKWKIADECFLKTSEIFRKRLDRFPLLAGKSNTVKNRAGSIFHYLGAEIRSGEDHLRIAIASYNCGDWAFYHYSKGNSIDQGTTAGPSGRPDYSEDVLARLEVFGQLLSRDYK